MWQAIYWKFENFCIENTSRFRVDCSWPFPPPGCGCFQCVNMEGEGFEQEVDTHEEWYQRVQPAVLSLPCKHSGFQSLDKYHKEPPPLITPPMCPPSADITPPRDRSPNPSLSLHDCNWKQSNTEGSQGLETRLAYTLCMSTQSHSQAPVFHHMEWEWDHIHFYVWQCWIEITTWNGNGNSCVFLSTQWDRK